MERTPLNVSTVFAGRAGLKRSSCFRSALLVFLAIIFCPPLFSAEPSGRTIYVTVAASSRFQEELNWKKEVQERLSLANRIFEKNFGIRFVISEFSSWEPEDETRAMSLLVEELSGKFSPGADRIVIGFHRVGQFFPKEQIREDADTVGTAAFFRGLVVIRDPFQELPAPLRKIVMAHELAHLFGAVHIAEPKAIMRPSLPAAPENILDAENVEIVRLGTAVDFSKGIDSLPDNAVSGLAERYEKLIRANPKSDFYYQLGLFYRKLGQNARAISTWEEAVRFHYDDPYIHRELGYFYFESSRFDKAIEELGSAIAHFILPSQKKDRVKSFNLLGVAYSSKGNLDEAIYNWLQGLAADPDDAGLQTNLATAYLARGDLDRGISELEKLLAKNPSDPATLSNLGIAYMKKKESVKAVSLFQKALEKRTQNINSGIKPDSGQISETALRTNLGAAYLELGKLEEALKELTLAQTFPDAGYETRNALAQTWLRKKDYEKAIPEILEAKKMKPEDPYLYAWLAEAYHGTGKSAEAMTAAEEGLRHARGGLKASLFKNLGYLYAEKKDFKNAEARLRSALNLEWNDAGTHTQLAAVMANQGKMEEATRSLQTALRINPGFQEAKKMLEQMKSVGSGQKTR